MSETDSLLFSVEDGIATVKINRPERRNAMSIEVSNGLHDIWEQVDDSPDIRVVIFTSADCGTFCAGMDLKQAATIKADTGKDILSFMKDPFQHRMRQVKVPIVAAMTGHLIAAGMMFSLNCDLRVGLAGSKVGITEARLGRGSPWATPLLWMIPQPLFMEMVLTADLYPIERLYEFGYINYVEPDPDAVRARALELARKIRDNAPLSVAAARQSILTAMSVGCENGLELAWQFHRQAYASEDAQEGPRAFAEKRPPRWKGR